MKCVVDTNIINRLIDGSLSTEHIPADAELVATHVQIDELNNTRDDERRARLFLRFATTVDSVIPTESTVLGVSRLGYSKLGDGGLYSRLKADLDSLNKGTANNTGRVPGVVEKQEGRILPVNGSTPSRPPR